MILRGPSWDTKLASITTRKNGSRFITFVDAEGRSRHITLGKVPKRSAETIKPKIEDLVFAAKHGHSPRDETTRWMAALDDQMYAKLVHVGLVAPRQNTTLQTWIDQYLEARRSEIKPESIRKLKQTAAKLLTHLDGNLPLRTLTTQHAVEWRQFLKDQNLSEAMIRTHCGNAKTILGEAVRRKLIDENPFAALKSGPTPSKYTRYITPEEIERVIEACPNAEWKLLFGLARYAGLRIPSESHSLTWANIDFDSARMTVHSPKTERHAGHVQRVVPITPPLMALLQNRFDECHEGEQPISNINGKGALIRKVRPIWARAGVEPWKRLWQTLRQSCEKQWAMTLPQYAVSKWIGHSMAISERHYANAVPDELFAKASELPHAAANSAQRQAQVNVAETARNGMKTETVAASGSDRTSGTRKDLRDSARTLESGAGGNRTPVPEQSACRLYVCSRFFDLGRLNRKRQRFRKPRQTKISLRGRLSVP